MIACCALVGLFGLSAVGSALAGQETGPNFNNNLETLNEIPSDRCVVAVLGPLLQEQRGSFVEGWSPPIDPPTIEWLQEKRNSGEIVLQFCDEETV